MNVEELKIHFFYLVTILTLALIVISTGLWTDKENFTEFLTNAATMISIVLGLVAIFYSFISNTSLNQSLGNITTVSNGVEKSNQLVNQFVAQAEQLNKANLQNSERMAGLSLSVDKQLDSLTALLKELDNKSTSLQESVSVLPTKLDSLELRFLDGLNTSNRSSQSNSTQLAFQYDEKLIRRTLNSTPIFNVLLIYACQIAYKKKLAVDLSKIQPFLGINNSYLMGVISAYSSMWLLGRDWESEEAQNYNFKITEMDEHLASYDIEGHIKRYLNDSSNVLGKEKSEAYEKDFHSLKNYLASLDYGAS